MFSTFFKTPKIKENEILLFTTFTLDEVVLVSLLNGYGVNKNQRIVVYHDIMRHRNPGYLFAHYPKSIVYSVILKKGNDHCPVFHTKLWARIHNKKLQKMIITSANISAYHLVNSGYKSGTFESYIEIPCANENLPNSFIFYNIKYDRSLRHERLNNVDPETILIDTRKKFKIGLSKNSIFDIIKRVDEIPVMCAAPFINGKAVNGILENKTKDKFKVYTGRNIKTGLALHAKLFLFEKTAILGSANLTAQALGSAGKTINHELIFLKKHRQKEFDAFKKFNEINIILCKSKSPGDDDPEDSIEDWNIERLKKIDGPKDALLKIRNEKAHIELTGSWQPGRIYFKTEHLEKSMPLKLTSNNILKPTNKSNEQFEFAKIVSKGNVKIFCKSYNNIIWEIGLDYGDYWQALELRSHFNGTSGNGDGINHLKSKRHIAQYDVRDMRQLAITEPDKGRKIAPFVRWLSTEGISVANIPEWCQELAHKIKESNA